MVTIGGSIFYVQQQYESYLVFDAVRAGILCDDVLDNLTGRETDLAEAHDENPPGTRPATRRALRYLDDVLERQRKAAETACAIRRGLPN